jgi:enoyl-CoA hydratase/carnithine racemase
MVSCEPAPLVGRSRHVHNPLARTDCDRSPQSECLPERPDVMGLPTDQPGPDPSFDLETLIVRREGAVLIVEIAAPPMNLLGPELVRDLVALIQRAEADEALKVLVFTSADPDYFISHVDVTRVAEYRAEAAKLTGEASIALMFRHLSASRLVTIAQVEGRVRGAGNEFVLSCDMRFAARESAVFAQFEAAFGQLAGGGGVQYLTRLLGRARTLEVVLSADDYDADLAERYGWINRALPAQELSDFVDALAHWSTIRVATAIG